MYTISMRIKLTKWGNSLGIRLPKVFAMHIGLREGSEVDIFVHKDSIVISNARPSLSSLLDTITPEMLHQETDTGDVRGHEVW
jgi:antitoxin MazE